WNGSAGDGNARPNAAGVEALAAQPHRQPWCIALVAINAGDVVHVVHDYVLVPVVIQISQGDALAHSARVESPDVAPFFKREVAAIAKSKFRKFEPRKPGAHAEGFGIRELFAAAGGLQFVGNVRVLNIPFES